MDTIKYRLKEKKERKEGMCTYRHICNYVCVLWVSVGVEWNWSAKAFTSKPLSFNYSL